MSERFHDIAVTVNGEDVRERVDARMTLVDFLRETLALTGTHIGCEHGLCGACTVRLDGEVVRGCLTLAVQCDGARGRHHRGRLGFRRDRRPADAHSRSATRCNAASARPACCSPRRRCCATARVPSRDKIRDHISGNYCRCTGYQAIVDAIEAVAQQRAGAQR